MGTAEDWSEVIVNYSTAAVTAYDTFMQYCSSRKTYDDIDQVREPRLPMPTISILFSATPGRCRPLVQCIYVQLLIRHWPPCRDRQPASMSLYSMSNQINIKNWITIACGLIELLLSWYYWFGDWDRIGPSAKPALAPLWPECWGQ